MYLHFKYFFDRVLALILLIIFLPLMVIISILLYYLTGSIIYRQPRVGYQNRIFTIYKFKSIINSDSGDYITKVGLILRYSNLDELPQLINIIKGDMSFIGPRPLVVTNLPLYSNEELKRHSVLPGITGFAQVNGRNSILSKDKFKLDLFYVKNVSPLLDLKIFFKTFYIAFNFKLTKNIEEVIPNRICYIGNSVDTINLLNYLGFRIIYGFNDIIIEDFDKLNIDSFDYFVLDIKKDIDTEYLLSFGIDILDLFIFKFK